MMAWLCTAGFFRGIALSNFTLTVSEYSSLEKLPAAFGKKLSRLENTNELNFFSHFRLAHGW